MLDFVGGNYVATFNTSTTLPYIMESFQNTDLKLFLDVGNVWGVDYSSSIDDSNKIRSSTGVALGIFTPVGKYVDSKHASWNAKSILICQYKLTYRW